MYENKVYAITHSKDNLGTRSTPSTDRGHLFAFGGTEEALLRRNLGCKARHSATGASFDHATGIGTVAAHDGVYAAAQAQGHAVFLLIAEPTGALAPGTIRFLHACSDAAAACVALDATTYGLARTATTSFFTHHLRRISNAIVVQHARLLNTAAGLIGQQVQAGMTGEDALRPPGGVSANVRARRLR